LGIAAARFLRPRINALNEAWLDVARTTEATGPAPIRMKVAIQRTTGWAGATEEKAVFVIPNQQPVLSAICPHEGCEVVWEQQKNRFACPCHDSFFGIDGSRISGPASRGLDSLPTRVVDGTIQVQYQETTLDHS
jgi:menaquinol-cytochrome c reductase iron-sulfur subunit